MEWLFALLGLIGGGVGAGIPLYLKLRQGVAEVRSKERADVEAEWARAVARLDSEVARQDVEIASLKADNTRLQSEHLQCIKENTAVQSDLRLLKFQVEQLQKISTSAAISLATTITADPTGSIVDADESVRDILGWRAAELIGRNVDVIIPRDIRGKHHQGFDRAMLSGSVRPETLAINSTAMTKTGDRIAVTVSLSGYRDTDGKYLIVAQIYHRKVFAIVDPGTAEHPAMKPEPTKSEVVVLPPGGSGVLKKGDSKHDS